MPDDSNTITRHVLKLYITGASSNSAKAISNVRQICNAHLKDAYDLEIIDIYTQPEIAAKEQIVAVPMLVKLQPLPKKILIGSMSDTERVLKGLEL